MERLTYKDGAKISSNADPDEILKKLAWYEDMDEEERLIELMAAPGTKIYTVDLECGRPEGAECPKVCGDCEYRNYVAGSITPKNKWQMALFSRTFGGDAFRTQKEAEEKAEKLNGGKEKG